MQVFFSVRLIRQELTGSLAETRDPDPLFSCELMDGRDNFLQTAREKHWEFSSLRRAQFSTISMAYQLNTEGQQEAYTCNGCDQRNAVFHCTTCEVGSRGLFSCGFCGG